MTRRRPALAALALLAALAPGAARPAAADEAASPGGEDKLLARALEIEEELVQAVDRVRRNTVSVLHLVRPKREGAAAAILPSVLRGVGSGVIVGQRGTWVLTNVHVVQGADEVAVVTYDGERHPMTVADTIDKYDIALLAFAKGAPKGIKGVPVKAASGLEEGAWVLATGNPFFLAVDGRCVSTLGVVSGLDRILGGKFLYGKAIQHDAEVNPGNSGGPLWNLRGDFIGINGMIASQASEGTGPHNTGCSFSIPSEQVAKFLASMIDAKTDAAAGDLGVAFETWMDKDGKPAGARVTQVRNGRLHEKDGLQKDDVITRVTPKGQSSTVIRTAADLTNLLSLLPSGLKLKIAYRRGKSMGTWSGELAAQ